MAALRQIGFREPERAWSIAHHLVRVARGLSPSLAPIDRLFDAVVRSFDPERGLSNLDALFSQADDRSAAELFRLIDQQPGVAPALTALCAGSQYLSNLIIHDPTLFLALAAESPDWRLRSRAEMSRALSAALDTVTTLDACLACLRAFKKREDLRIGLCDLLKHADTVDIVQSLSDVADVCLQGAYEVCTTLLERQHGPPVLRDETGSRPCEFAVIGMGKLGGQELNFSSDIDLLYVYSSTDGATTFSQLSTYEYYPKLARMITDAVSRITPDGFAFRVDLRLRPEGRAGDIANSVDGYRWHYDALGQIWERQALIKARTVAGSAAVGDRFFDAIRPFVFHPEADPLVLDDIHRMRLKINRALLERGKGDRNVKLGPGGIREIEFIVQGFQLIYGGAQDWPWERNTLRALAWITRHGYLTEHEATDLRDAYLFLRDLENRIQMAAGHQTHDIPQGERERATLARTIGLAGRSDEESADLLLTRYRTHTGRVRQIYERVFHSTL
ncbi:MAG: hypothetical protein HY710_14390 [Candidatus Latescibacteria bacterium]|nr:hypothetical protein [Candidatus Latescibacterota bacterium]